MSMQRIVISGCSGGGKSTLLQEMARRGFVTIPEPGRLIVQQQLSQGGSALPWQDLSAFLELCLLKAREQYASVRKIETPAIFDRSVIDTITAIEWLSGSVFPGKVSLLEDIQYSSVVYMAPPWEALFTYDNERRHSYDVACKEYARLICSYPDNGYAINVLPKTSVIERANYLESQFLKLS